MRIAGHAGGHGDDVGPRERLTADDAGTTDFTETTEAVELEERGGVAYDAEGVSCPPMRSEGTDNGETANAANTD